MPQNHVPQNHVPQNHVPQNRRSRTSRLGRRPLLAVLVALVSALVVGGLPVLPAVALSRGVAFSAESLPTWQVDGFAYAVTSVAGRTVVGGNFAHLTPPAGTSAAAVTTSGLAVLDADSGQPTSCQLSAALTGGTPTIYALAASPSGSVVYVGGDFSSLGGVAVQRVAAVDVASCSVTAMRVPAVSSIVYGLAATSDTLYLAGRFSSVSGATRNGFAAVSTTTGALLPFAPDVDRPGRAMALSPDGTKLAVGGDFTTVNGAASHSIAVVDATSGATVKAYGAGFVDAASVTKTIVSDGSSFYTGNEGTGVGVFDGRIALDWSTLSERWRDTCLGATQSLAVYRGILYSATHAHDCGSIGAYQNGTRKYFLAEGTADRTLRGWFPLGNDGVNEKIGPRGLAVVTGASGRTYLYAVGEFTQINGVAQRGVTRFGTTDANAPAAPYLQAEALTSNAVQIRVWTVVDSDDDTLTYRVYRDGSSTPLWTGAATSFWWTRPQITVTDDDVTPGKTYSYRVTASDGTSTSVLSGSASATPRTKATDYPAQVVADGARLYWRFDEPAGGTWTWDKGADSTSAPNGLLARGTAFGATGAIGTDSAATFDGVDDYAWSDQLRPAPTVFSVETWIKTTTTRGGKIIGYSDSRPQTDTGVLTPANNVDRHVYMDDTGRLSFGTYDTTASVLRSPKAYNDGRWHHVVASLDPAGMVLYVDGARVGRNTRGSAKVYPGVWKVGGDKLLGWPNQPTSDYFAGTIDDTAVYEGKALSADTVLKHYQLSGATPAFNDAPTNSYGAAVYAADPDLYWPLADASGAVADQSRYAQRPGTAGSGVTRRVATPLGDRLGVTTDGTAAGTVSTSTADTAPSQFSEETWFRTSARTGGKLVGFESAPTGTSAASDRQLYLTDAGAVVGGVTPASGDVAVSSAPGFADGQWHHAALTQDSTGLRLYVDGRQVGSNATPLNQAGSGYWRVGGGDLSGWPNRPTSDYFAGSLDEVAVYDHALSASEIARHAGIGGRDVVAPTTPTQVVATVSHDDVGLTWGASSDDVGVTGYVVYRGTTPDFAATAASQLQTTTGRSFTDARRPSGTWYYRVSARDAAGNQSPPTNAVKAAVVDTTAPTVPGSLLSSVSGTTVRLSWGPASDDGGIAAYTVYRGTTASFTVNDASRVGQSTTTSYADGSRPAGTWYYRVAATDPSGNTSAASSVRSAVVAQAQSTTLTLNATADTMVAENNPNGSYGTYNQLSTRAPGSASELQTYLRFDLSALPAGATVVSATLKVTTSNDSTAASTGASTVQLLTGSWSEASTLWGNRPTELGARLGELSSAPALNTGYEIGLDASALAPDSSGSVNLALLGSTSDNLRISSREATSTGARPQLVLSYR